MSICEKSKRFTHPIMHVLMNSVHDKRVHSLYYFWICIFSSQVFYIRNFSVLTLLFCGYVVYFIEKENFNKTWVLSFTDGYSYIDAIATYSIILKCIKIDDDSITCVYSLLVHDFLLHSVHRKLLWFWNIYNFFKWPNFLRFLFKSFYWI